jgi:ribosomal protein L13E
VEIRKIGDPRLLASVEAFYFKGKSKIQKKVLPPKSKDENIYKFPPVQALVKCSDRVPTGRKGKGFSKKEVIDAEMDLKDMRRLNIPYDKRRKSSHQSNINTLRRRYENDGRR